MHPNEKAARAEREIKSLAPGALIFSEGNVEPMIANCDIADVCMRVLETDWVGSQNKPTIASSLPKRPVAARS